MFTILISIKKFTIGIKNEVGIPDNLHEYDPFPDGTSWERLQNIYQISGP